MKSPRAWSSAIGLMLTSVAFSACGIKVPGMNINLGHDDHVEGHLVPQPAKTDYAAMLDKAIEDGDAEALQRALQGGADPNALRGSDFPLHRAASLGRLEIMRALLKAGAKVDQSTQLYGSAFDGAMQCEARSSIDCFAVARELLSQGADPNLVDTGGKTHLERTLETYRPGYQDYFIRLLLTHGADPKKASERVNKNPRINDDSVARKLLDGDVSHSLPDAAFFSGPTQATTVNYSGDAQPAKTYPVDVIARRLTASSLSLTIVASSVPRIQSTAITYVFSQDLKKVTASFGLYIADRVTRQFKIAAASSCAYSEGDSVLDCTIDDTIPCIGGAVDFPVCGVKPGIPGRYQGTARWKEKFRIDFREKGAFERSALIEVHRDGEHEDPFVFEDRLNRQD